MLRGTLDAETVSNSDAVLLVTDHDYLDLNILENSDVPVLDTKNALKGASVEHL
jgi:UDP-N-acetyl-D-mannosaminuronate dehydrogenase